MRRGNMHKGPLERDGVIFGFCLGADFCAEHEWGIKRIYEEFGIEPDYTLRRSPLGMANTQIKHFPENRVKFFRLDWRAYIINEDEWHWRDGKKEIPGELRCYKNSKGDTDPRDEVCGAWDGDSFGLNVDYKKYGKAAEELFEAMKALNVSITFFGAGENPFDRAGLALIITDKFPKDLNDRLIKDQTDAYHLHDAAEATGLRQHIKKVEEERRKEDNHFYGFYHGLRPAFKDGVIQWWLNPQDQQKNNWGWYSTQEIKDWVDGKPNKIVKASPAVA